MKKYFFSKNNGLMNILSMRGNIFNRLPVVSYGKTTIPLFSFGNQLGITCGESLALNKKRPENEPGIRKSKAQGQGQALARTNTGYDVPPKMVAPPVTEMRTKVVKYQRSLNIKCPAGTPL